MKRILVGVDGSEESKHAMRTAGEIARATGSALELTHVVPALLEPTLDPSAPHHETSHARAGQFLLQELASESAPAETTLLQGDPAQRLAQEAKRPEVWMIVVGHRGRGSVVRTVLGSVADRLTQISPKPVLVVR